jgi:predicted ChrR family anti-sigma factor
MVPDTYHSFLMDHVNEALSADLALAAELHVVLKEEARAVTETWRQVRDTMLGSSERRQSNERDHLPEALELCVGGFKTVPWKRGLSGVHYAKRGRGRGQLMRLDPGQAAPHHSHSVLEATVVLQGAFDDGQGINHRGDLVLGWPGMTHRPAAAGDEVCICYVAREPKPFWRLS